MNQIFINTLLTLVCSYYKAAPVQGGLNTSLTNLKKGTNKLLCFHLHNHINDSLHALQTFLPLLYVSGPRTDPLAKASRLDPCFTKFNDIYICKAAALKKCMSPLKTFFFTSHDVFLQRRRCCVSVTTFFIVRTASLDWPLKCCLCVRFQFIY